MKLLFSPPFRIAPSEKSVCVAHVSEAGTYEGGVDYRIAWGSARRLALLSFYSAVRVAAVPGRPLGTPGSNPAPPCCCSVVPALVAGV